MQAGLSWGLLVPFDSSEQDLPPRVGRTSDGSPCQTPWHQALQDVRSALAGHGSLPGAGAPPSASAALLAAGASAARAVLEYSAAAWAVSKRRTCLAAAAEPGERRSPTPSTCTSVKPPWERTMSAESCVPRDVGSAASSKIQTPTAASAELAVTAAAFAAFVGFCGVGAGAEAAADFAFSFSPSFFEPLAPLANVTRLFSMKSTRLCLLRPALKPGSMGEPFAPFA
mmetsp:Transcript_67845/g.214637  ORF Transcript_67845/g.214637 Transcript_67845/m.214637 type:complete len:227 (-) Transcript_67845:644-1324(-)